MNCGVRASQRAGPRNDSQAHFPRSRPDPRAGRCSGRSGSRAQTAPCRSARPPNYRPSITSWRCSSMNLPSVVMGGRAPPRKKADAVFKIAFARRSSRFSHSNSTNRRRSSDASPGRARASISGFDTTNLVRSAAAAGPLPDGHPTAALWWRILDQLPPGRPNQDPRAPAVPATRRTTTTSRDQQLPRPPSAPPPSSAEPRLRPFTTLESLSVVSPKHFSCLDQMRPTAPRCPAQDSIRVVVSAVMNGRNRRGISRRQLRSRQRSRVPQLSSTEQSSRLA